jgi:hypothetical protein
MLIKVRSKTEKKEETNDINLVCLIFMPKKKGRIAP